MLIGLLAVTLSAHAQGLEPEINAQNFRPTLDQHGALWADDARWGPDRMPFERVLLHYAHEPLLYVHGNGDVTRLVASHLQADLLAGFTYERVRVGVDLPAYLYSTGDLRGPTGGLGDLSLAMKIALLEPDSRVGVAVSGQTWLPTSTMKGAMASRNVRWEASLVGDVVIGEKTLFALNVGYLGGPEAVLSEVEVDDFVVWRAALTQEFSPAWGAALEGAGQHGTAQLRAPGSNGTELLASGWHRWAESWVVRAGFGVGVTKGVGTPDYRLLFSVGYEPTWRDTDGDGIVDQRDACPSEPEDADGWADTDGCIDADNDGDGVLDAADACRDAPEDADGWQDEDGCAETSVQVTVRVIGPSGAPLDIARTTASSGGTAAAGADEVTLVVEPGPLAVSATAFGHTPAEATFEVVDGPPTAFDLRLEELPAQRVAVSRSRIDLRDQIRFETSKATIKPESYALLDDAVAALKAYPEIERLRIEGHTDSRGSATSNKDLSQRRADAVRKYFVDHGIAPERLTTIGYGEERPLDPAETPEAWTKNRRVDFFIEVWAPTP